MEIGQWVPELSLGGNGVGSQGRKGDSFIKYCSMPGMSCSSDQGFLEAWVSSGGFCVEEEQFSRPQNDSLRTPVELDNP